MADLESNHDVLSLNCLKLISNKLQRHLIVLFDIFSVADNRKIDEGRVQPFYSLHLFENVTMAKDFTLE